MVTKTAGLSITVGQKKVKEQFFKELGVNTLIGTVVFAWVFGQAPLSDVETTKAPAAPIVKQDTAKRNHQIPTVQQASVKDIEIRIEPTAAPAPLPGFYGQENLMEVAASKLKLRAKPTARSKSIAIYPNGSAFAMIGQEGKWLQVRHVEDGTSGWMHGDYLKAVN